MKQKLIFLTVLLITLSTFSAEYFVDASRPDDSGAATNWATAKKTIQAAVDLTENGDTVWITNGTYVLSSEIFVTKAIIIRSVNGSEVTVVNGNRSTRCFYLANDCFISGLSIINGYNRTESSGRFRSDGCGAGVFCETSAVVSNCVIRGNVVDGGGDYPHGGGMSGGRVVNSIFENNKADGHDQTGGGNGGGVGGGMSAGNALYCIFRGNQADGGGGMYNGLASNCIFVGNSAVGDWSAGDEACWGGGLEWGTAYDCIFTNNSATLGGGMDGGLAVRCAFVNNSATVDGGGASYIHAYDCLFVLNSAEEGGALYCGSPYNCTIMGNRASSLGGGYCDDYTFQSTKKIQNTILWQNEPSDFYFASSSDFLILNSCSTQLAYGVDGNITNAPLFVDAANGNFGLQSNSPCINWGNNSYVTNSTDLDGNPRIVEGVVDMGAYEYQGTVGLTDSDFDGINDDWERSYGGNQSPERTCSNGVNTLLQAYVAGLDPNDPQSKFTTTVSGQTLRWNATSGRVYAVYYSTNLLSGFQPLATNIPWTAGCFTDCVHNAHGQLFYKIDVKLEGAGDGNPFLPPGGGDDDTPSTRI